MANRAAHFILTTLMLTAGWFASPAAGQASPVIGEVFTLTGPAIDLGHTSCGDLGCIGEGNLWLYDSSFQPGPDGCPVLGSHSASCQLQRTTMVILDNALSTSVTAEKFYGNTSMGPPQVFDFTLPPNAFSATFGILWDDGSDANSLSMFSNFFLVRSGTNPTLGECVDGLQLIQTLTATEPVNGPDCIKVPSSYWSLRKLGYGLPGWAPYDLVGQHIAGTTSDPVRTLMTGLVSTGPISFINGAKAFIQVVSQPHITQPQMIVTVAPTTVSGTTTLHIEAPVTFAGSVPWNYIVMYRVYGNATLTNLLANTGTTGTMIVRDAGTAAAPIGFSHVWTGGSSDSISTLVFDSALEGVAPGTVYVRVTVQGYSIDPRLNPPATIAEKVVPLTISNAVPPLSLLSVQSRKTHGSAGDCNLDISLSVPVTVEPRTIGGGHTLVFHFNNPVTSVTAAATARDALANSVGTATAFAVNGNVEVILTNVADNTRLTLSLSGLNGSGTGAVALGFLVGDVTNSQAVNAADISAVKANVGKTVDGITCKFDLNANGFISQSDVSTVKARSGLVLPP